MADSPQLRREQIMQWLRQNGTMPIEELVTRLGVSLMTVHRDLDQLVKEGLARKSYGCAVLESAAKSGVTRPMPVLCDLCRSLVSGRTAFTIQLRDHSRLEACCPHCGLLMWLRQSQGAVALAQDYLYGRMVNAYAAYYVFGSRLHLCCMPTILCLASREDADSLTTGFGGVTMDFREACAHLGLHNGHDTHDHGEAGQEHP